MNYYQFSSTGDLFTIIEHQEKIAALKVGINKLDDYIDWENFRAELEDILGYSKRDSKKGGRPPFDPVLMLKVLLIQKFYDLSDAATEQQIQDRFSFMSFLGLRPGDTVPDKNTIWDFKQALEKNGCNGTERLFKHFQEQLNKEGLISKEGSIVDASFVDAPRQRNSRDQNNEIKSGKRPEGFEKDTNKGRQKDCDARWSKKNQEVHYGYKNHVKIDAKSKLIVKGMTTAGNVHDSQVFKDLVDKEDNAVFADSAYQSEEIEKYVLETCDSEEFIMLKGKRGKPLSEEEKATNKLRSRIRARVEHVFGRMKQLGMDYVRSIGLPRAIQHNTLCNLLYNLDRYRVLIG
jgi:transposase, IS5 family